MRYAYAMAQPPQGGGGAQPSPIMSMLPIFLIFFIFYFLLIRPQQKKQQEHQEMVKKLGKNDEVVTNGGIHGTIVNVKDETVVLRVDDNCKMEVQRNSIAAIRKKRD
jgi:preprotein translocase subunit YajC